MYAHTYYIDLLADQVPSELPAAEPEIHALLSKLQDMHGNLEPDWGSSDPHLEQRKATARGGENGAPRWDGRPGLMENDGDGVAKERCVLEDFTPCSKSHLWKLMMSFYDRKGVESWSQVRTPSGDDCHLPCPCFTYLLVAFVVFCP